MRERAGSVVLARVFHSAAPGGRGEPAHGSGSIYEACSQVSEWGQKIESIVDWFGELQKVNVEGVPAAVRAYESDSNLR